MSSYHLAQVNIALAKFENDDPRFADFMNALDEVNALSEAAEGFVWRLKGDNNNATEVRAFDNDMLLINISVWESVDALFNFTYKNDRHLEFFRRRKEWFEAPPGLKHMAMWWIPAGETPTPADARAKLEQLTAEGPSPDVFTFKKRFDPPTE